MREKVTEVMKSADQRYLGQDHYVKPGRANKDK